MTSTRKAKPTKQNPQIDCDVCVVGAGPAGLVAALMFGQAGLATTLVAPGIDQADGRSTALLESSASLLRDLGIWDDIEAASSLLVRMRLIDATERLIRAPEVIFDSQELDLPAFGYNILNVDLNRILKEKMEACGSITFVEESGEHYAFGDNANTVTTSSGQNVTAKLLVAADGRNSNIRTAAGIKVKTWSYPQVAVVGNLDHTQPHYDTSTEFHTRTGPFTLVPMEGYRSSLVCVETPEGAEQLLSLSKPDLERELERRAHSVLGKFQLASSFQKFPLSGMNAQTVAGPRTALIGETAHVFPPIGAQGLNLSLRDVAELGRTVLKAQAAGKDIGSSDVLSSYAQKRKTDIKSRTTAVDALNRSLLSDFLPVQLARSVGLYMADRAPFVRNFLMSQGLAPGHKRTKNPLSALIQRVSSR
ncbi:MAG: UbiH/UbiF family hydroxylase [Rhodobacteraceae bacterium]|nr:UbiH/UbiF family hydroxylase [Paracoccaceae bacterium]